MFNFYFKLVQIRSVMRPLLFKRKLHLVEAGVDNIYQLGLFLWNVFNIEIGKPVLKTRVFISEPIGTRWPAIVADKETDQYNT